ncbi:helix-turn-helix transcriptional regulator [Bombella dulcis]|uniref:helix-turn-helix transcriptional regulator n=1 Tax=Bombella dulcis TaxID=2967339 RepID=UPI00389938BE
MAAQREHQIGEEGISKIEPLRSKGEVSKYLGVSKPTLERYIRQGKFPNGFRLCNGHLRWTKKTLLAEVEKAAQSEMESA